MEDDYIRVIIIMGAIIGAIITWATALWFILN